MDIISMFPCLIPLDEKNCCFDGFVTVAGRDYRLRISTPNGNLKKANIYIDWRLQYIWEENKLLIRQRLDQSEDLKGFLTELQYALEQSVSTVSSSVNVDFSPLHYKQILCDIEELGWDKVTFINDEFNEIHLKALDVAARTHVLQIEVLQASDDPFTIKADLPRPFVVHKEKKYSLTTIYELFQHQLGLYQEFWNHMDEIDANTWILDPEVPKRKDTNRRIGISYCASLQIIVDPLHVEAIPESYFVGSDEAVSELNEVFNSNLEKWDKSSSLLNNLKALGLKFLSPKETVKEDFTIECGICYVYHLGDSVPDKVCDNPQCHHPFHSACLYEWLKALSTSRQSFNKIFGDCPYCRKPINCKMPGSK